MTSKPEIAEGTLKFGKPPGPPNHLASAAVRVQVFGYGLRQAINVSPPVGSKLVSTRAQVIDQHGNPSGEPVSIITDQVTGGGQLYSLTFEDDTLQPPITLVSVTIGFSMPVGRSGPFWVQNAVLGDNQPQYVQVLKLHGLLGIQNPPAVLDANGNPTSPSRVNVFGSSMNADNSAYSLSFLGLEAIYMPVWVRAQLTIAPSFPY